MPINIYYYDNNTVSVPTVLPANGLFIPVSNLPGTDATDFAVGVSAGCKESQAIYALLQRFHSFLATSANKLGLNSNISNPSIINSSTITYTFSFVVDYLMNNAAGSASMLPIPDTGVYSGIGDFSLQDIFQNIVLISDKANQSNLITTAGILIDESSLSRYGFYNDVVGSAITTFNVGGDNRYAVAAIISGICDGNVSIRSNSLASAILSTAISDPTVVAIPTNYYSTTNPLTDISSTDLDHLGILRRIYSTTFELRLLPEFLEVNVATS